MINLKSKTIAIYIIFCLTQSNQLNCTGKNIRSAIAGNAIKVMKFGLRATACSVILVTTATGLAALKITTKTLKPRKHAKS